MLSRTRVVSMRLTESEYQQLAEEAEKRNTSISRLLMEVWRNKKAQTPISLESWIKLQQGVEQLRGSFNQLARFQERYADWMLQLLVPQTDPEWNRLKTELQTLKLLLKENDRN